MELPGAFFSPSSKNEKKIHHEKIFYIPRKWNFLMELSCISGNGNPKKLLVFQEVTSHAREMKKPL